MQTYEVHGPDPDGDYWVVEVEEDGAVTTETSLPETYLTRETAQVAAALLNANPANVLTQ